MKKHTKILATVGPACESVETLEAMIRAGVNVFRLNFSHGTHEYHSGILKNIHTAMQRCGLVVGVLQDISGPKVRIGKIEGLWELQTGDRITFQKEECTGLIEGPGRYRLSINRPELLEKVKTDELIYLYDGVICTRVVSVGDEVEVVVENGAKLTSKKGVNFPNTPLGIEVLTEKDREDMRWGVKHGVDFMAISFVQDAADMIKARDLINEYGGDTALFAKIEKFDAVENIDAILEASDGIMVARGDLGIEIPYYRVPAVQKELIRKANALAKPVITATQMLLSMTSSERATRAEISDVANAVLDGTDAVMLSEESAVGKFPVKAIETMFNTIRDAETIYDYHQFGRFEKRDETDMIDESTALLAHNLEAEAILAMTTSGQSARKLARYRPEKPIMAVTHHHRVAQKLTIVWGVLPTFITKATTVEKMTSEIVQHGLERNILHKEARYVLTAGDPVGVAGTTNMIRILRQKELEYFAKNMKTGKTKKEQEGAASLF